MRHPTTLLALGFVLLSCQKPAPPSPEDRAPERLGAETNEEIIARDGCSEVLELDQDGLHYKVLVFGASSRDPGLVAYRSSAGGFGRAGSIFLSGYSAPQLATENGETFIRTIQEGGPTPIPMRVVIARGSLDIKVDDARLQQTLGTQVKVKKSTIWGSSQGSLDQYDVTADVFDAGPK